MSIPKILFNNVNKMSFYKSKAKVIKSCRNMVPYIESPLLLFSLKGSRNVNLDTCKDNAIEIQKNLYNAEKITKKEYEDRVKKIKDYYNNAKNMPETVSSQTIKRSEPTFKSEYHSSDGHLDIHDLSDTPSVSEIRDIDVSMPIELQEYMNTPMNHVQDGLISNIFDEFPDDFDVDEGLLSKLRGFIEHVEEWL